MSLKIAINNADHIQGDNNASIELVEYGDYQCSYCGKSYPVVKELQRQLGNKLKFVFRNFPLTNIHSRALNAAIATEVAGDMGKFWEMHDIVFENQGFLSDANLVKYAAEIGLDVAEFEKLFTAKKYLNKVEADIDGGLWSGVNSTPTFFVNGRRYPGNPYSVKEFLAYFDSIA